MGTPPRITKTSTDVELLSFEYARTNNPYLSSGEAITSAQVVVVPSGSNLAVSSVSFTGSAVLFYIGGGTVKQVAEVAGYAYTNFGRLAVRSFTLEVVPAKWGAV